MKQVTFDPGSAVTEIRFKAFYNSGIESFTAPPSLRKIDALAFGECRNLKTFEPNEDVQLGWLCLLHAVVTDLRLPPHVTMTRVQLGLDQEDPKVLRLPDGLEVIGDDWFWESDVEKLIIPNTVRELGHSAFSWCEKLREVVFEPDSRLEAIREFCFAHSMLE